MKKIRQFLNLVSRLNSGHNLHNRSTGLKLLVITGMFLVFVLTLLGAMQLFKE